VLPEILMMEFAFLLLDQCSTRIPQAVWGRTGYFGALIWAMRLSRPSCVGPFRSSVARATLGGVCFHEACSEHRGPDAPVRLYQRRSRWAGFFGLCAALLVVLVPL
jgi:hypothetical protein